MFPPHFPSINSPLSVPHVCSFLPLNLNNYYHTWAWCKGYSTYQPISPTFWERGSKHKTSNNLSSPQFDVFLISNRPLLRISTFSITLYTSIILINNVFLFSCGLSRFSFLLLWLLEGPPHWSAHHITDVSKPLQTCLIAPAVPVASFFSLLHRCWSLIYTWINSYSNYFYL